MHTACARRPAGPARCDPHLLLFFAVTEFAQLWFVSYHGFRAHFGDITLWNSLAFCVLLPYISSYSCVTTLIRWGHGRSVAPETASMAEGARFRLNTRHHCPDPLVTGCHAPAP